MTATAPIPLHARRRPHFVTDRPLTTAETDVLVAEMMVMSEEASEDLAQCALDAAHAEAKYRVAHAREYLTSGHKTDAARNAQAVVATAELLEARKVADARVVGAQELCRTRREQLSGARTLDASARAAQQG